VDDLAAVRFGPVAAFHDDAADVLILDRATADRPLHVEQPTLRRAAAQVDRHAVQPHVGHVLGLADGGAYGPLGFVQIDDAAAAHAAPLLPAEAHHAQRAVGLHAADQAADLGRADVDDAERAAAVRAGTRGLLRFDRGQRDAA